MADAPPKASVVMRSKNSDWVIGQALAGLYSQEYRDFELIIVDSGSTDTTLDIVRRYPHTLIEIEAKAYFPGAVLNSALEHCRGEIIVLQNSDSVPLSPHSLGRLVAAFDDPAVAAAFGRQLPRPEAETWVRSDYAKSFPEKGPVPEWIALSFPLAGIRRSVWKGRPFYTDAWASEDTEWGNWARRAGHTIAYVADAIVMHSHNYSLREIYGRRFVEGEADAFIYGARSSLTRLPLNVARSILRDAADHARARDVWGLAKSPARRAVFYWAHHMGHRLGEARKARGDGDGSVGQETVLARRIR